MAINKSQDIQLEVKSNDLNFCALTETFLKVEDNVIPLHLGPSDCNILSVPRKDKQGRGVALLYHNKLTIIKGKPYDFDSMECTDFKISLPGSSLNMAVIYHPLDTSVLPFVDQLTDYMGWNINQSGKMLLLEDLNIKVNDKEDPYILIFSDFLESFDMCN